MGLRIWNQLINDYTKLISKIRIKYEVHKFAALQYVVFRPLETEINIFCIL